MHDKGVLLTTYDIVRNNAKSLRGDYYFHDERSEDDITWDYMILDECFSFTNKHVHTCIMGLPSVIKSDKRIKAPRSPRALGSRRKVRCGLCRSKAHHGRLK
ncbi:hypothetical protein CsSME_00003004 [Camellia sinensis var. sinensis]